MTTSISDYLKENGRITYSNVGVSMLPLLRQGRDLMVIERKNGESFKKYDAVLFRRPNARGRDDYVLHRILRINKDGSYWIVGDNCCTRLLGDTVCMPACNMVLSASHFLAGINTVWGAGPAEMPAFIYIYPYPTDSRHVGAPFIYQTTPRWTPSHYFWGEDDWLFVEGWNPQTQQSCYHKVRLPSGSRR